LNPRLGNFCVPDLYSFESGETVKVFQTCVCKLNVVKIQNLDFRQPRQMSDSRVGYFRAKTEVEISKICQPSQVLEAGVRDRGVIKSQRF